MFDSLVALTVWELWNERNARVFRAKSVQPAILANMTLAELQEWNRAGLVARIRDE
jgi:hypothetical protein